VKRRRAIPVEIKRAIEENAVGYIASSYRAFRSGSLRKEPCLSVGEVADYLRQANMPTDFSWASKAEQRQWTRSVLESLRRRGKLSSSLGCPTSGRREVRCYEPKESK